MWSPKLREAHLSHIVTAVGVSLIALTLSAGPLGSPGQTSSPSRPLVASAEASVPANSPTRLGESVSYRGERAGGSSPATNSSPAATPTDVPPATPTASPTATPSPTAAASPTPVPNPAPARNLRVGIQAGHWKESELPAELASLRSSTGATGSGWKEVDVNLDVARRVQGLLEKQGVQVDLIPATVPVGYKADAFVALHGDANSNTTVSGYKLARATLSSIPAKDDALLSAISSEYAASTGLRNHPSSITVNMTAYYAFANRGIPHSVAPTTPSVILEMGFLTTASDRETLLEQPDVVAQAIASGVLKYLTN